jgi:HSP20 family protein
MNVLKEWTRSLGHAWDSLAEGWRDLRESAAGAMTRFLPSSSGNGSAPPADATFPAGWAVLAADVFDSDDHIVVRLEAPGMQKSDFKVEVRDGVLVVKGEKRVERQSGHGQYRLMQCAYGRFQRAVPLPVPVRGERARARYRDGVLRIELPKAEGAPRPRRIAVQAA